MSTIISSQQPGLRWHFRPARHTEAAPSVEPRDLVDLPKAPPVPAEELKAKKVKKERHPIKTALKVAAWSALAATSAIIVAGTALLDPSALGPVGKPLNSAIVSVLPDSGKMAYHWMTDPNPHVETADKYGQLYTFSPNADGKYTVLADSGKTTPNGSDIPASAVKDNRVVIGFEGIEGGQRSYVNTFGNLFNSDKGAVNLNQDFLMIHEGNRERAIDDIGRILHDDLTMKEVQLGHVPSMASIAKSDPAVVTGYNVIKQALDADHQVMIFAHSGGGAEADLALNLLSHNGYKDKIHDDVKIMIMAGAASAPDAVKAGVQEGNALYVGMDEDVVAGLGHTWIDPSHPVAGLKELYNSVTHATDFSLGKWHSPNETIVPRNIEHVEAFFNDGVGGTYLAH